MPVPVFEREEHNTDTPFGSYREKSSQRIVYTRKTSHLVTELNYRHVLFSHEMGEAPDKHYIYQASFKGYNLSSPMQFKVGRIISGNNSLQTIDGGSWYYPWGNSLSMNIDVGKVAAIDSARPNQPSFAEGRAHYRLNDNAFMALKAVQLFDEKSGGAMLGYNAEGLRIFGEFLAGRATDTMQLSMQYIKPGSFDLTSDYALYYHDDADTGRMRHLAGYETGNLYFEAGTGSSFNFNMDDKNECWFYEGSMSWGLTDNDKLMFGMIHETVPASSSKTIYAQAERRISRNTRLRLGVEDTRFENTPLSVQNLEASLWRKVQWGYFELRGAMITGGSDAKLQKDIRLRAGYEF